MLDERRVGYLEGLVRELGERGLVARVVRSRSGPAFCRVINPEAASLSENVMCAPEPGAAITPLVLLVVLGGAHARRRGSMRRGRQGGTRPGGPPRYVRATSRRRNLAPRLGRRSAQRPRRRAANRQRGERPAGPLPVARTDRSRGASSIAGPCGTPPYRHLSGAAAACRAYGTLDQPWTHTSGRPSPFAYHRGARLTGDAAPRGGRQGGFFLVLAFSTASRSSRSWRHKGTAENYCRKPSQHGMPADLEPQPQRPPDPHLHRMARRREPDPHARTEDHPVRRHRAAAPPDREPDDHPDHPADGRGHDVRAHPRAYADDLRRQSRPGQRAPQAARRDDGSVLRSIASIIILGTATSRCSATSAWTSHRSSPARASSASRSPRRAERRQGLPHRHLHAAGGPVRRGRRGQPGARRRGRSRR